MTVLLGEKATFELNKTARVHRWYPYVEGFSCDFVSELLREFDKARRILDPFAGTGTTPLVVTHLGLDAGWVEVNPLMRLVIEAKLEAVPALAARGRHGVIEAFERASMVHGAIALGTDVSDLSFMYTRRAFFEERILRDLRAAVSWIDTIDYDPALRDILRLAVAAVTVSCSNMKRAADLRYRRGREVEEVERDVGAALDLQLARMKDDLLALGTDGPGFLGRASKVGEDARSLAGGAAGGRGGRSPPTQAGPTSTSSSPRRLTSTGRTTSGTPSSSSSSWA